MSRLTPINLQNYISTLQNLYSKSTINRKLSSIRRFIKFLHEKKRVDKEKANQLIKSTLNTHFIEQARPLQRKNVVAQLAESNNNGTMEQWNNGKNEKHKINYKITNKSHITATIIIFLIFSLNIFLVGKLQSKISKDILALSNKDTPFKFERSLLEKGDIGLKLTLSGNLTDNFQIPLSYEQEISFSIYPSAASPSAIYATGRCRVSPDNDGNFTIVLGDDCGKPIPYSLYAENLELYLGITIGFGSELNPRLQFKKIEILLPNSPASQPAQTPTPLPLFIDETSTESAEAATESAAEK